MTRHHLLSSSVNVYLQEGSHLCKSSSSLLLRQREHIGSPEYGTIAMDVKNSKGKRWHIWDLFATQIVACTLLLTNFSVDMDV
jgi:hypothetical protein